MTVTPHIARFTILISGGRTFFKVGGQSARQKTMEIFLMKRFTLTIDPILIVLLKII